MSAHLARYRSKMGSKIISIRRHGVLVTTTFTDMYESYVKRSLVQNEILYYLNISAAIVQGASAIIILAAAGSDMEYSIYSTVPISTPSDSSSDSSDNTSTFIPTSKELFSVDICHLCAVYLFISSFEHLLVSMIKKKAYEHGLKNDHNIFRWVEYTFTVSFMKIIVGIISGIVDLNTLILIFGHSATSMILSLVFELQNSGKRMDHLVQWHTYWLAFIPHTFVWIIIMEYLVGIDVSDSAHVCVRPTVIAIFILDLIFPILLGLQWRAKGFFRLYATGEIIFTVFALTSKNILAWTTFLSAYYQ